MSALARRATLLLVLLLVGAGCGLAASTQPGRDGTAQQNPGDGQ